MPIHNLAKIFHPQSVAVIGASARPGAVGQTVLQNMIAAKFPGEILAINPKHESVLGLPAYPAIADVPRVPDLAIVCTPAATVPEIVAQCGEVGVGGLIILAAGFREVGEQGQALEQKLAETSAQFPSLRIMGPNCLGVIVPAARLNASFAASLPQPGKVAFISQSGALCTSVLDWSLGKNIGFSKFISIGNALNVKVGDLIDYLSEDPHTDSIVLYVESITESRNFLSAARAFTRTKPIVVYKAGRFAESAQAAASHTGAMAGVDAVYEAAFQRAGMVRVDEAEDMFDCAELLARQRPPQGPQLAIVTNAGGPGVMATDALLDRGGVLAKLSPETLSQLDQQLPAAWSRGNPVDILGDADPARFADALEVVLHDPGVDAVLVTLTPQAMTVPTETALAVIQSASQTRKPILTAWMGGASVHAGRDLLASANIASYGSPERAVRAFSYLLKYQRNRQILYETPRNLCPESPRQRDQVDQQLRALAGGGKQILSETQAKGLLAAYEVPVTQPVPAATAAAAVALAQRVGYPVVLKVDAPQITHKTEVGGVVVGISSEAEVRQAFEKIVAAAAAQRPDAEVLGVTVQKMCSAAGGVELIVGAKRDPVFGAVMLVGAGGITAEVLRDHALELPPLNERLALRMLQSLRTWPLLQAYRGRPAVDLDRLIQTLIRISHLIAEHPAIAELDVNPLLATAEDAVALDARIVWDAELASPSTKSYSHLAIRPYPQEYLHHHQLPDGTPVLFRPIQPEDEPAWHAMLARCSERSLWLRFRYLFKETTHEMATRFCFIDYDRTLAIVAEITTADQQRLIGVGRLVADADHQHAEYAVLVEDAWQGQGLGLALTDYCLEICQSWGIDRVVAETTMDNNRMQAIFTQCGFQRGKFLGDNELLFQREFQSDVSP